MSVELVGFDPRTTPLSTAALAISFPAEMTIVVERTKLGTDRGVVWFADGLMGFSGVAAAFVLAAFDLDPKGYGRDHPRTGNAYPTGAIVLRNAPREAYVIVTPLSGYEEAYRERLKAFMWTEERPDAERFWPPLVPYESAYALEPGAVRG